MNHNEPQVDLESIADEQPVATRLFEGLDGWLRDGTRQALKAAGYQADPVTVAQVARILRESAGAYHNSTRPLARLIGASESTAKRLREKALRRTRKIGEAGAVALYGERIGLAQPAAFLGASDRGRILNVDDVPRDDDVRHVIDSLDVILQARPGAWYREVIARLAAFCAERPGSACDRAAAEACNLNWSDPQWRGKTLLWEDQVETRQEALLLRLRTGSRKRLRNLWRKRSQTGARNERLRDKVDEDRLARDVRKYRSERAKRILERLALTDADAREALRRIGIGEIDAEEALDRRHSGLQVDG